MKKLILTLIATAFFGCTEPKNEQASTRSLQAVKQDAYLTVPGNSEALDTIKEMLSGSKNAPTIKSWLDESVDKKYDLKVLWASKQFEQADAATRQYLASIKQHPLATYVEQDMALFVLDNYLLEANSSKEATRYYVDLLAKNGSPEADIILRGVNQAKSEWTAAEIQSIYKSTTKSVKQNVENCEECSLDKQQKQGEKISKIQEAVQEMN